MEKKLSAAEKRQVAAFLELFAKQGKHLRKEFTTTIPEYNELLNMHALTFPQFALLEAAEAQGLPVADPLFSYDDVFPPCPKCGKEGQVRHGQDGAYVCRACKAKFTANYKSISSGTKYDSTIWLKVLHCMRDFYSVQRTCEVCGIARDTFYLIRNKLFYGMQIMLEDLKLYGNIQCDNTFVRVNFKGRDLNSREYPEDSPVYVEKSIPREARKRGGSYRNEERNVNSLCIFAAVDEFGHVMLKYVGLGQPSAARLIKNVSAERFVQTVPPSDPWSLKKPRSSKGEGKACSRPGSTSRLISDGEAAIGKLAESLGLEHESHVYRRGHKQLKLAATAHNIQRANQVHSRLKEFLRNSHYVSSKYLPGFLVFFEFIENTGMTQEAICQLFKTLARPGLERPREYFKDLYTVPNYLRQWLQDDSPLKKFRYNQLLGYWLYRQRVEAIRAGDKNVQTVAAISRACGLSEKAIRKLYQTLHGTEYDGLILEFFSEEGAGKMSHGVAARNTFEPEVLAAYDEFCANRRKRGEEQLAFSEFLASVNRRYKKDYKESTLRRKFRQISESGLRPPIPPRAMKSAYGDTGVYENLLHYREEYDERVAQCRREGVELSGSAIIAEMAERAGVTVSTMKGYVFSTASRIRNRKKNAAKNRVRDE